jgi:hypothetical protein
MQTSREPPPLTKEQADRIASAWLASAREMSAPLKRGSINWLWLLPALAVGIFTLGCGVYLQNQAIEVFGLAIALLGAYMALRPIGGLADFGAKLSAKPSPRVRLSMQLASAVIVFCLIAYYLKR